MRGNLPKHQKSGPFEYIASTAETGTVVVSGIPLRGKLTASLVPDPITGVWKLKLQPPSLLDAIWLQLGQAITSDAASFASAFNAATRSRLEDNRAGGLMQSSVRICRVDYNSLRRSQAQ